ncbi:MAG TPA: hypothetical protein PLB01_05895 [Thermoanaerobaculia bacterium]|nr:hypothetical protein [Thermoanaerobaculia bacterium]
MRLTAKGSRTGALLFSPLALVLGCGRAPDAPKVPTATATSALNNYTDVGITITRDATGKPVPDKDPLPLSKKELHRAHWKYCGAGLLNVHMTDESDDPFDGSWERWSESECKHIRSPKIHPKAREKDQATATKPYKRYKYTISLLVDGQYIPNDPEIEIDR